MAWHLVPQSDVEVGTALLLLQRSFQDGQYSHLSVEILRNKMVAKRLYIWSYGSLLNPDASAFFFLRRKHKSSGNMKNPAFCMTVGARPYDPGPPKKGLTKDELRAAIRAVCLQEMRPKIPVENPPIGLEVMHASSVPNFRDPAQNLALAFSDASSNSANPPRLVDNGSIDVDKPWGDAPATIRRWNVNE